jgi:hypothetical protein
MPSSTLAPDSVEIRGLGDVAEIGAGLLVVATIEERSSNLCLTAVSSSPWR